MIDRDASDRSEVTAQLEGLLREQLEHYGRLRNLADRQRQLVAQDDPQPLLALLGERQRVVDELAGLSERLVPVQRAWRGQAHDLDPDHRRHIEELLQRIGKTLQSVLDSDAEDARRLAARKQQTHASLQQVGEGQRALNAYQASTVGARPHFAATDESI